MKSGELARLARAWGVDGGQLSRELHRQEQELARPLPGAVARARCARLLDLAAEDAAQVTDPAKRAALRIKLAGETARLHGIAGGQGGRPRPAGSPAVGGRADPSRGAAPNAGGGPARQKVSPRSVLLVLLVALEGLVDELAGPSKLAALCCGPCKAALRGPVSGASARRDRLPRVARGLH
jgi:hypothetical protein